MQFQVRVVLDVTCINRAGIEVADPAPGSRAHGRLVRALADAVGNSLRRGRVDLTDRMRIHIKHIDEALPVVEGRPTAEEVLREFVDDVNRSGGLVSAPTSPGLTTPAASLGWTDLAVTYEDACDALGLAPVYNSEEE